MTTKRSPKSPRPTLSAVQPDAPSHVQPTPRERAAADAYLLGDHVADPELAATIQKVVDEFGWAEVNYIAEARTQGPQSRIWNTTGWIIANAIARERA